MALFDLAGRRWILRIVWELHRAGRPLTFRDLRTQCSDVSSSVLTTRLGELTDDLLVTHVGDGYVLTELGEGFVVAMAPLIEWSRDWDRSARGPQHDKDEHHEDDTDDKCEELHGAASPTGPGRAARPLVSSS